MAGLRTGRSLGKRTFGFTLIEILVALAIISIGLIALMGEQLKSMDSMEFSMNLTKAVLISREEMTRIELGNFPNLGTEEGDFGERFPDFRWIRTVNPPPEPLSQDVVREVILMLKWKERGTEKTYDLTNYIMNRGIKQE